MTLALALVLIGGAMLYAGIKGKSFTGLLFGDNTIPSRTPQPVAREEQEPK